MGAAGPGRTHKVSWVIIGPARGTGSGWTGGSQSASPPGPGLGSGLGPNPGSSWSTPSVEGPRPGHALQGKPNTAEPHPGPH